MDNGSSSGARPLIVTQDQDLLEQLLRLCAAAGVAADLVESVETARQAWLRASAVLVGEDLAPAAATADFARRDRVILVSAAREREALWRLAVALGADDVVLLPSGQLPLAARLSDLADGPFRGQTIAVVGGSGGAGASTLATALALTAGQSGRRTLLVDADPFGGGIDLLVGCEDVTGLRWAEVAMTHGRVTAAAFRAALPTLGDLAILSFDRSRAMVVDPTTLRAMISAGQRGAEVVVVDVPRQLDDAAAEAARCADVLVLVATTDIRGVAGAQLLLPSIRDLCANIRLVVRRLPGTTVSASAVADTLGLPLVAELPSRVSVTRAVNDGLGPPSRRGLQSGCRAVLQLLSAVGGAR